MSDRMTHIDFYFNASDKLEVARKLATKAFGRGLNTLVYVEDTVLATRLDHDFWTREQRDFLPHVRCGHALAAQTPILIGTIPDELGRADILINLEAAAPGCFARFERVLEIVGVDEADRERGRERFRYYRERGYQLASHDLSSRA